MRKSVAPIEQHNDEEDQTATHEENQQNTVEQEETTQTEKLGTQASLTPHPPFSGPDSAVHLVAKETLTEQPQNKDDDQEGENDSGEEYEEYKEAPFYYNSSYSKEIKQA
jgi:hypothetical protein